MPSPVKEQTATTAQREYALHASLNTADILGAALGRIKSRAKWADTSAGSALAVAERLASAIKDQQPLSLVRVGDGTGNLLGCEQPEFQNLKKLASRQILEMTFGTSDFSETELQNIIYGLKAGIKSADILGVSDEIRLGRLADIDRLSDRGSDLRGFSGSRESYVAIADLLERENVSPSMIVSNHIHRYLAPHIAHVLSNVRELCVIGPYDLARQIKSSFGVEHVHTILIPNQADTSRQGQKWYPDGFESVLAQIDPQRHGQTHLVASGLLAKQLCAEIKIKGGIAIDIGSLVDVWAGIPVRKYHDQQFITANKLDNGR